MITNILLEETNGIARENEPVSLGVPFAQGQVKNFKNIFLRDVKKIVKLQKKPLSYWHDGSVKWLLLDFLAFIEPYQTKKYILDVYSSVKPLAYSTDKIWHIDISRDYFLTAALHNRICLFKLHLVDVNNKKHTLFFKKENNSNDGCIRSTIFLQGNFLNVLKICLRIHIFHDAQRVKLEFTIHNPKRAKHSNGIWDLGDRGSYSFRDLSLEMNTSNDSIGCNLLKQTHSQLSIYQGSSGGRNWNSQNHVDKEGKINTTFCGYKISENGNLLQRGKRATPTVHFRNKGSFVASLFIENFWQNFPKAINCDSQKIVLHLFPKHSSIFELQAGEQKTHIIHVDLKKPLIPEPLFPKLDISYYKQTKTIPFVIEQKTEIDTIVEKAVNGENSFVNRNEKIDEYGWRNFGDIFADHEEVNNLQEGFISHYNNQYDLIYGFFLQYIRTGTASWYFFMTNLAKHVIDIDIYRTKKDKFSYNNGLFWHTNHYLSAETATHRCYSREHLHQVENPKLYGGGPSNEHNYTTGLLYYYFASGDEQAKEAVLLLANWVIDMEDGSKNIFQFIDKGNTGLSSQTYSCDYHGPGRGGGNSINALLDAYSLTHEQKYLYNAEKIIKRCVHPSDCFVALKLAQPEERWSYTVFLQVLGKYLMQKEQVRSFDYMYEYAVTSLLHYAKWMSKHEYLYLDKPEKLEYPTETWTAQEIRKSHVFFLASRYCDDIEFLKKMHFFYQEPIKRFTTIHSKQHFVRPIAILMHWGNIYHYAIQNQDKLMWQKKVDFIEKENFVPQKAKVKNKLKKLIYAVVIFFVLLVFILSLGILSKAQ